MTALGAQNPRVASPTGTQPAPHSRASASALPTARLLRERSEDPSTAFADASLYAARRQRVLTLAGPGAAIIVPSARIAARNSDVDHDFRQDSDLYYLTGFDEPDAVAVLRPGQIPEFALFLRPRDPDAETWHGRRLGVEGAVQRLGAGAAWQINELDSQLPGLLAGTDTVWHTLGRDAALDRSVVAAAQRHRRLPRGLERGPDRLVDLRALLSDVRMIKGEAEIAALRMAGQLSAEGHHEAMRLCAPGRWEFELQAALEVVFRLGGSPRNGYPSIVAGGDNATILHYNTNRMRVRDGDLVLIDAGAEIGYHTADITRCFPVSGRFSPAQRDVYAIVLAAEEAAIDVTRAGRAYIAAHEVALNVLVQGLCDLKILQGSVEELVAQEAYKPWYMHRTGHWLGMDVHDVGLYAEGGAPRVLAPGMVTTVEPGLYFGIDDERVPAALRGIGVRIEDDVLVTDGAPDVLTVDCVKSIADVEAMCAEAPRFLRG